MEKIKIAKGPQHQKRKPNEFKVENGIVYVTIRHEQRPNCTMLIDEADWPFIQSLGTVCSFKTPSGEYAYVVTNETVDGFQKQGRIMVTHALFRDVRPQVVDHWNHNTLDNRRENLRPTTTAINSINKRLRRPQSGYRGVSFCKRTQKWVASLWRNGKRLYFGCSYLTAEEAHQAIVKELQGQDWDHTQAVTTHTV